MSIVAIYRVYYGADWIKYAIRSVIDQVDQVVVFYNDEPWCGVREVEWKGGNLAVPSTSPDGADKVLLSLNHPRLHVLKDDHPDQAGQSSRHVARVCEKLGRPDLVMIASCDHVEREDLVATVVGQEMFHRVISTRPIDLWKWPHLRLPQRVDKPSTTIWDLKKWDWKIPYDELWDVKKDGLQWSDHPTFNMHFASSPLTMWWRFMLRHEQAPTLPDDDVVWGWYDRWLEWRPGVADPELGWCRGERQLGQPYELDVEPPRVLKGLIEESREWAGKGL